jgi:hypothetical protein
MSIFNFLFGSTDEQEQTANDYQSWRNDNPENPSDDDFYETTGYSQTHYRDDPFYQELLGISEDDRKRERQSESHVDDDDEPKKGWFGPW